MAEARRPPRFEAFIDEFARRRVPLWGRYRQPHEPLLTEWLARNYPIGTWRRNVRVGPPHPEAVLAVIPPHLRRVAEITVAQVDAIVELADLTVLVEAMIKSDFGKIEELRMYRDLYLMDPKFAHRRGIPIELVLVSPIWNELLAVRARRQGIRFVFYRPDWIEPYLYSLTPRHRSARLQGIAEREGSP